MFYPPFPILGGNQFFYPQSYHEVKFSFWFPPNNLLALSIQKIFETVSHQSLCPIPGLPAVFAYKLPQFRAEMLPHESISASACQWPRSNTRLLYTPRKILISIDTNNLFRDKPHQNNYTKRRK